MRIFHKEKPSLPKLGDVRIKRGFVIWKRIGGETRILCRASWAQRLGTRYCPSYCDGIPGHHALYWWDTMFVDDPLEPKWYEWLGAKGS